MAAEIGESPLLAIPPQQPRTADSDYLDTAATGPTEGLETWAKRVGASREKFHTTEKATCPVVDIRGDYHLEGRCEDCDVAVFSRMTPDQIDYRYQTGRASQDDYEAYMHAWALLSPSGSGGGWLTVPEDVNIRRLIRKLLRARGAAIPPTLELSGPAADSPPCQASCCGPGYWQTLPGRDREAP
ncbi:hypothetical protein OG749_36055 [Streptomyces nojiriensis]|uniref:hypothetical protein n=1 Tax=Streptomyces nojiriensis TaxID=66374 RepID=UPI002E19C8EF